MYKLNIIFKKKLISYQNKNKQPRFNVILYIYYTFTLQRY
jgi:hypothetical protein